MRVAIIADADKVNVDGVARFVDLSALDPNIHAVQWDSATSTGHVEYKDRSPETALTDISDYQSFIDAWTAAEPPPPTLADNKQEKGQEFLTEAVNRMAARVPDWDNLSTIQTVAGLWVSHLATNATAAQAAAKDIYLYVRDTVPAKLAAVATQAELDGIDPSAADPFGDGTPWPA